MKIKKHFLTLFMVIVFLLFAPNAKASYGDLRYEVTDVEVIGTKITFKGWAFIHKTNNYVTVYKSNNESQGELVTGGGQSVTIAAYKSETEIAKETNDVTRANPQGKWKDYNFYSNQFFQFSNWNAGGKTKEYYYNRGLEDGYGDNLCTTADDSQCYYQDVYFDITLDLKKEIEDVNGEEEICFKIRVTNKDYQKRKGKDAYVEETLGISKKTADSIKNNPYFLSANSSNEVKFIAENAVLRWNKTESSNAYGEIGSQYILNGESAPTDQFLGAETGGLLGIGITESVDRSADGHHIYKPGNDKKAYAFATWLKPNSTFKITLIGQKKCDASSPTNATTKCNNSKEITSECKQLTINKIKNEYQANAEVKITEKGTLNNILTPTTIYAGGGFKLGMIYYNTITWEIKSLNCYYKGENISQKENCIDIVNTEIKSKVKKVNEIKNDIKVKTEYDGESINMKVNCDKIEDNDNKSITTICTIFLPKSNVEEYTVKVTYTSENGNGIQNKYYTSIKKSGIKKIQFEITGLNILNKEQEKKDTKGTNNRWAGEWNIKTSGDKDDNCNINVYSLLETPQNKYKFIYRPININNPFPNRNAGVNWDEWYKKDSNKQRLKDSYSNLEYKINLDNSTIISIKEYNKNKNYLDWNGITSSEKSTFVNDYFKCKEGKGDCS